jgi:nicotinate-nucleotide pyrophosphorylase (carboxylating)
LNDLARVLSRAIEKIRAKHDVRFVEVEADSLDQFRELLRMEKGLIDMVLLDNMSLDQLREAVRLRNSTAPGILLEASGGVTLETVKDIAKTGVDRISVGALTHSAPNLDVGLDME